jgi:hypothetical protein
MSCIDQFFSVNDDDGDRKKDKSTVGIEFGACSIGDASEVQEESPLKIDPQSKGANAKHRDGKRATKTKKQQTNSPAVSDGENQDDGDKRVRSSRRKNEPKKNRNKSPSESDEGEPEQGSKQVCHVFQLCIYTNHV